MPRPHVHRRRPNPRSPYSSRRAPFDDGTPPPNDRPMRARLEKQLANKKVGQRKQDSDDSDGLVTQKQSRLGRVEPIYASGGVAKGDAPGVFPTKDAVMKKLRSDTNEIIRRSRSGSANSATETASKPQSTKSQPNNKREAPVLVASSQQSATESPRNIPAKAQSTPGAERSILGSLKPRRRQDSILQMIDNDSSSINPEDEEQFLPDDESTPLQRNKANATKTPPRVSAGPTNLSSLKRKRGSDMPNVSMPVARPDSMDVDMVPTSHSPEMTPAHPIKKRAVAVDEDDILAPPQSSSPEPEPEPEQILPSSIKKSEKSRPVPTTAQLQVLMPSKRRKGTRERKVVSEFDIPPDSTSSNASETEEPSIYVLKKKTKQRKGKKGAGAATAAVPTATKRGTKAQPSPTKSTSTLPSNPISLLPTVPRTPLPLTRNVNQENKITASVKGHRSKDTEKDEGKQKGEGKKQSGGSRPPRTTTVTATAQIQTRTANDEDKENRVFGSGRVLRKRAGTIDAVVVHPSIEEDDTDADCGAEEAGGDDRDVEMSDDSLIVTPQSTRKRTTKPVKKAGAEDGGRVEFAGNDTKAWKDKWGDIDNWSLEFEDVGVRRGGSGDGGDGGVPSSSGSSLIKVSLT